MNAKKNSRPASREDIAHRAYQLWEQDGSPHGRDHDHWYRAEQELANAHASEDGDLDTSPIALNDIPSTPITRQEAMKPAGPPPSDSVSRAPSKGAPKRAGCRSSSLFFF